MATPDKHPIVLIGVVGYSPLIEAFPLGPRLMRRLEAEPWRVTATVENMTWSPLHIVQRFQDGSLTADRLVLLGAADVCREPGNIGCHHWQGGSLPAEVLQERMYEAVTGIVSLDNTLMIGEHFAVWPDEVLTVELEMSPQTFGEIVMAEAEGAADRASLLTRLGFDPFGATEQLAQLAIVCATHGVAADLDLLPKSAGTLAPHPSFSHTAFAGSP
jgi:hypothetical protein